MTAEELLFQVHPLPWRLVRWATYDTPSIIDANNQLVADPGNAMVVTFANAYPRAALAERAVELLEKMLAAKPAIMVLPARRALKISEELTEFLADARRVLKEGT